MLQIDQSIRQKNEWSIKDDDLFGRFFVGNVVSARNSHRHRFRKMDVYEHNVRCRVTIQVRHGPISLQFCRHTRILARKMR